MKRTRKILGVVTIVALLVGSVPFIAQPAQAVGGTISGHVYEADGEPAIPIHNVHLYAVDATTYEWRAGTFTDSSGNYTLSGLPTGSYLVRACPSETGLSFVDRWYDGVYNRDEATPVSVNATDDTGGIDFSLEVGGTISGNVTDTATNDPVSNARVEVIVYESLSGWWLHYGDGRTDASGNYTTSALPTGEYGVRVRADGYVIEWYQDTYNQNEATSVSVNATDDTPGINFSLELGGTISGNVTDSTGQPVIDARVEVIVYDSVLGLVPWQHYGDGWTDASGNYTTSAVPTGEYGVRVRADGYVMEWYLDTYNRNEASPVSVNATDDTPNINFSLEEGGTISGNVTDSTGQPVSDARVEVIVYDSWSGPGPWLDYGWARTDADGYYTTSAVPTGEYGVRVRADGYVFEWYQDTYNQNDATRVSVNATDDTPGINFILELGGTISGYVYKADSTPIPDLHVYAEDATTYQWMAGANTDSDGSYTLGGLPTGSYLVRAYPPETGLSYVSKWYDGVYDRDKATPVSVNATDDTPDINFSLEEGGTISGNVTDSTTGLPVIDARVEVIVYESLSGWWLHYGDGRTDASGNYTTSAVPTGEYGVRVKADGCYINEWYPGTYNQNDATRVSVNATDDTPNINFSLEEGGTISGRVLDSDTGLPVIGARVEAIVYESLFEHHLHYGDGHADASGNYTTSGLPPGQYALRAKTDGYATKWYDDTYSKDEATSVEVTDLGDIPGKDFTLDAVVPRETIEEAIADGTAWLAGQQNVDGSWGTLYPLAKTALAVLKLESHAIDLELSPFAEAYPYSDNVQAGLNYIFANAYTTNITTQRAGDPDRDGDGIGVYFYIPGEGHDGAVYHIYNTGIAMMAIAASTTPDSVVSVEGSPVDNWTYEQVLRDAVDYLAWAQTDYGFGRGGWNYSAMNNAGSRSDQSNSGWATLALFHAQAPPPIGFSLPVPGFVKRELDVWIDYIQNDVDGDPEDGGADYEGPEGGHELWVNILKTGNLLLQMAFVGDTEETPRVMNAVDYLVRHWGERHDPGWRGYPSCYHTTYTTMKGLEALNILAIGSIDWFQDFTDALLGEQAADGWWLSSRWDDGDRILSTAWAMLTLQEVAPPSPPLPRPVADAGGPYLVAVRLPVTFNGTDSYDPDGEIVDYCWIFGDGKAGSGVSANNTYITAGLYTAELTVTDNVGGIDTDTAMVVVYDPAAGFATGGGWFIPGGPTSDVGDFLPDIDYSSSAEFGFVVKYKPGATEVGGQLEFQYRQGDFNLHSKGMEWLVIVNNNWAKFQGSATIKGLEGLWPFRVDARDGDFGGGTAVDRFIIKVYTPGSNPDQSDPEYKASGDLKGGSIVIHAKKVTTLRVQSSYPADMLGYQVFESWAQEISEASGGRLNIEPYPDGAIVPTSEMFDAVQSGTLDGCAAWPQSWTGKHALANYLSSYPFGLDEPYMWETWFYERGGIELAREDYARFNMHYVGLVMGAPEYAHCVKPLNTKADWDGLKCRYPPGMIYDVFTEAGAVVTPMPGGEIWQAMKEGRIELGEFNSHYWNQQLKLYQVGPYIIGPGQMHSAVTIQAFVVNMDTWNSLSSKLQGLLTTGVNDLSSSTLSALQAADLDALNWMVETGNCTYIKIPPVERAKFRLISIKFWKGYATDPISLQAVKSQILLMDEEGLLDFPGIKEEIEKYFPDLLH